MFFPFLVGVLVAVAADPIVKTPLGVVEGYWSSSLNGRRYAAFDGIPYAQPPVGELRFEEAKPIQPWLGVWQAKNLYKCIQYNHYTEPGQDFVIGEEDCLYLNVYSPIFNESNSLDVIVFIHGGAFMYNSGAAYGPKFIMDRDVIYVTFNYRLGPLGFLSTEDSVVPGNLGLKDQLLALKWIKENIRHFGGNPDSITITGMSAGGASVHLHYLSPLSKGIFHRGISQSGTALNAWVLMENALQKTKQLANICGCYSDEVKKIIECLKNRPARQIVDSVKYFLPWLYNPFSPFGVVVDKWSKNPIVPEHPYLLLKSKKTQHLPLIFSSVESEGLYPAADFISDPKYLTEIEENWDTLIPYILDFNNTIDDKTEVNKRIKRFYFDEARVSELSFPKLVKMLSDRLFTADIIKAAKLHSSATSAPVYYYYFTYRGAHSKSEVRSHNNNNYGASHGDDTVYVLSTNIDTHSTDDDIKMSELLLDMWINFAKNGIPKLGSLNWKEMSKEKSNQVKYAYVKSPSDIEMQTADNLGNGKFWNELPLKENEKLLNIREEL